MRWCGVQYPSKSLPTMINGIFWTSSHVGARTVVYAYFIILLIYGSGKKKKKKTEKKKKNPRRNRTQYKEFREEMRPHVGDDDWKTKGVRLCFYDSGWAVILLPVLRTYNNGGICVAGIILYIYIQGYSGHIYIIIILYKYIDYTYGRY